MKIFGGFLLVGLGVIVLIFGARKLPIKDGPLIDAISQKPIGVQLIRWVVGILLILLGLAIVFGGI